MGTFVWECQLLSEDNSITSLFLIIHWNEHYLEGGGGGARGWGWSDLSTSWEVNLGDESKYWQHSKFCDKVTPNTPTMFFFIWMP